MIQNTKHISRMNKSMLVSMLYIVLCVIFTLHTLHNLGGCFMFGQWGKGRKIRLYLIGLMPKAYI